MDIHEHQAKERLAAFGVPIPRGAVAFSPEQTRQRVRELAGEGGSGRVVVKAQIHSGGRGEAGGVTLCDDEDAAATAAAGLLGRMLATRQTGPAGKLVSRLYVEEATAIAREIYLGFVLDRASERVMVLASAEGGMEIEQISAEKPESLIRLSVDPATGLRDFQARKLAFALGLAPAQIGEAVGIIKAAYRAFRDLDAVMVEINPLVVTEEGRLVALDAKMSIDDNALFRRPALAALRDKSQEDPRESRAADRGLAYVGLDGTIGCMVNGAGLAMATLDMIRLAGGQPANFLDIGGGASPERVLEAFRTVLADRRVEVILVNVFAGINRCDWVAEGVIAAYRTLDVHLPVVVRLSGTNVEEGRALIAGSGLPIVTADTLADAAEKAVAALPVSEPTPKSVSEREVA